MSFQDLKNKCRVLTEENKELKSRNSILNELMYLLVKYNGGEISFNKAELENDLKDMIENKREVQIKVNDEDDTLDLKIK